MIDTYSLDKDRFLFFVIVNAALFIYMLYDQKRIIDLSRDQAKFRRSIIYMFIVGILTLIISSILVAVSFPKWDFNMIKAFLMFGNIGLKPGGLPYARAIGYQFISLGIMTLLVYFVSTTRKNDGVNK